MSDKSRTARDINDLTLVEIGISTIAIASDSMSLYIIGGQRSQLSYNITLHSHAILTGDMKSPGEKIHIMLHTYGHLLSYLYPQRVRCNKRASSFNSTARLIIYRLSMCTRSQRGDRFKGSLLLPRARRSVCIAHRELAERQSRCLLNGKFAPRSIQTHIDSRFRAGANPSTRANDTRTPSKSSHTCNRMCYAQMNSVVLSVIIAKRRRNVK